MRFSQKIGKTPLRDTLQVDSIDQMLENRLWNTILNHFFNKIEGYTSSLVRDSPRADASKYIWEEFFGKRIDEIPSYDSGKVMTEIVIKYIKDRFFESEWYEKYDFIEFLSRIEGFLNIDFPNECNFALKKELSGYRIIEKNIVQITSEEEISEIEDALSNSSKWQPVNTHLKSSLQYFSNRESPDYRNSIKEAISAVESFCVIITEDKSASLAKALGIIEKKYKIHGALKSAFSSLYGYTSDSGGIRHSLLEDDIAVSMEDAKFMLVSYSAFINYLKVKISS